MVELFLRYPGCSGAVPDPARRWYFSEVLFAATGTGAGDKRLKYHTSALYVTMDNGGDLERIPIT